MKPFLYERIISALLLELSSGHYKAGDRFLSLREITQRFGVSKPTANLVQEILKKRGLLEAKPRSGVYVGEQAREQAMLLLEHIPFASIPTPKTWISHRNRLLHVTRKDGYRIAILYHNPFSIHQKTLTLGQFSNELPTWFRGAQGVVKAGQSRNAQISIAEYNGSTERTQIIKTWLKEEQFDGLVFIQRAHSFPHFHELADPYLTQQMPIVHLFGNPQGEDIISIDFNNAAAGYQAVTRLASAGRRRLTVLIVHPFMTTSLLRVEGARLAAESLGLDFQVLELTATNRPLRLKPLFSGKGAPDAIFSVGYEFGALAIEQIRSVGLIPGRDVSCIATSHKPDLPCGSKMDIMKINFDAATSIAIHTVLNKIEGQDVHRAILIPMEYEAWGTV